MQPKAYCKGCFPELRITILLITALLAVSSKSVAQKVTISRNNVSLEVVFKDIRKQTGYSFIYRNEWIQKLGKISIDVKDAALSQVMDICLEGRPFTYNIENRIITIYPLVEKRTGDVPPAAEDSLIYGHVGNAAGVPLVGVSIMNVTRRASQKIATVSRADGSFEIEGQKGDKLMFTIIGFGKTEVKFNGGQEMTVSMKEEAVDLNTVEISNQDLSHKRIPWTDTIDMSFRSHMNLGQVLQGTIPGLTLQSSSQTHTTLTSVEWPPNASLNYGRQISTMEDIRRKYNEQIAEGSLPPSTSFEAFLNKVILPYVKANYTTSVNNNGLVPQLRGVSGFSGNTSGMLIVIDGFPQDGFPADYPMTNIASVKVIKDPETLTRWGPRAAGGVILIASKRGESGKLRWGYNTNLYYAPHPRFDRNRQRLATSADILDYLKDASDSGFIFTSPDPSGKHIFNQSPAEQLLYKLRSGTVSQDSFNAQWDSLGRLSNEQQLGLLQQDAVNQNHMLTLSGGNAAWRFNAAGIYSTSRTNALNNYNRNIGVNMFNNFLLLNEKLHADWNIKINRGQFRQGTSLDPAALQPYQLLLDTNGGYIYDYSRFNPQANTLLVNAGYNDYGVNLLQDARLNSNINRMLNAESQLNMNWELLPGLKWSASFQYMLSRSNTTDLQDAESSQARQLVDEYASPVFNTATTDQDRKLTGIKFYVPKGGILRKSYSEDKSWNVRSGLIFSKKSGKHDLNVALGGSSSAALSKTPPYTSIYGYNPETGKGQPVLLPFDPLASVGNYFQLPGVLGYGDQDPNTLLPVGTSNYPYTLLVPSQASTMAQRQLGWNGRIKYNFNDTYILNGDYNAVFNPSYGYSPPYTTLANYNAEATWRLYKHPFLHAPAWVSDLRISAGVTGVEIPSLPTEIGAMRTLQTAWNNYSIWVSNYNLAQQTGQRVRNIYEKLTIGLAANSLMLDLVHNSISIKGLEKTMGVNSTNNYVGANVRANFRRGLLNLMASYGRSPEGEPQTNLRANYNIAGETYFHAASISSLNADFILQHISPYQAMGLMMETNTPKADGAYSMAINNSFGLLPPETSNMEAHTSIGFLNDRYLLDLRYYRKVISGLNNNIPVPTDPSTGLGAQVSYSEIVSKGIELYLVVKVVQREKFRYVITLNGAYNKNIAQHVPTVNFSQTPAYLTAYRNGYSTESIWGYRWAGLDNKGNPQIYDNQGKITAAPDSAVLASALIYAGVSRAPYNGGLIQEWNFNDFFARATLAFKLGHVMQQYIPSPSGILDNSSLIRDRWRKPGDELHTDVAAMANTNTTGTRTFIIQHSTNSILPADNIRLQEFQIGWQAPGKLLKEFFVKDLTLSFQAQNLVVWKRNKLRIDPEIVSTGGQIGMPMPKQYSFSINMNF